MIMQVVEGMNAADGTANVGTKVRGMDPGAMLVKFVEHSARRFNDRATEADKAPAQGPTKHALQILEERKNSVQQTLATQVVNFLNQPKTLAKITVGKDPVRERTVNIAAASPSCECGAYLVESIPCGCMCIVAEKAGLSVESLLPTFCTNEFLKSIYTNLPEFHVPGTEFLAGGSGATVPADKPQQPGRPPNKRKKSAMDYVQQAAHAARHPPPN